MSKKHTMILLFAALFLIFVTSAVNGLGAKPAQPPDARKMEITGVIAKAAHSYVIRGKKPAEVFTILNEDPLILDDLVKTGKVVHLEVRIVSGDNVEIKMIDGKEYQQAAEQ